MASFQIKDSELEALQGKTVLIVGAATGIGRATVFLAHRKCDSRVCGRLRHIGLLTLIFVVRKAMART
jgi:NAD(P)-dependent dehydrogenase (short-subunit alcohol dehydrogenase family)